MLSVMETDKYLLHETQDGMNPEAEVFSSHRSSSFTELSVHIQEMIFSTLPFGTLSKIRLVCRHFNVVCSSLLNKEFRRLQNYVQRKLTNVKQQMPRRESIRRKHLLTRECDILEILHMKLTLLQMAFGKHIERNFCCFFPGEILDEVHKILSYITNTRNLNQVYKITEELFDLTTMAMEYFKEHVEPSLPEITYFGIDFMDYEPNVSKIHSHISSIEKNGSIPVSQHSSVQKQLQKIQSNVKRNNKQVVSLRRKLRTTQHRMHRQQKQMIHLKIQLDRYDSQLIDVSNKLNTVIQELGCCKTELQLWRSKSPSTQCTCAKAGQIKGQSMPENSGAEDVLHKIEFKPIPVMANDVPPICNCTLSSRLPEVLNNELSGMTLYLQ